MLKDSNSFYVGVLKMINVHNHLFLCLNLTLQYLHYIKIKKINLKRLIYIF